MSAAPSDLSTGIPASAESPRTLARPSVRARYFNAFRIASYLLVLYAIGHTTGAVLQTPKFGTESDAVVAMMKSVHVTAEGADCTWYGFYRGFGFLVTVFFVFSAVLTWHVGGAELRARRSVAPVTWALFLGYSTSIVLTWVYFFLVPSLFSTAITLVLGFACVQDWRAARRMTDGV